MRALCLVLIGLLLLPPASSQAPSDAMDIVVTMPPEGAPTQQGGEGILTFENESDGRVTWRIGFEGNNVAIELRIARTFGVERAEQIVPLLQLDEGESRCIDVRAKGACDDATFVPYPNARVWEAGDVGRAYHRNGTLGDLVLRLNVPGPANGTLALEPDTVAPVVTADEPERITHIGFYLESRTDELAIVDVQVRKMGETEWVQNPTSDLNLVQRFPVQGLDADSEYEYRLVAHDWAQNTATGPVLRLRSAPAPVLPIPVVTVLSPEPNATLRASVIPVVVRATIESPESPVPAAQIQVFFDKRPVNEGVAFDGTNLTYTPQAVVAAGRHSVAIEATNELGGKGVARWSFDVVEANDAPGVPVVALLAGVALLALLRRARS